MEKKTFWGFRLGHLSNDDANSLFKSTLETVMPLEGQLGDIARAVLREFAVNAEKYGEQVNAQKRSRLTDKVTLMDKKSDNLLAETKRAVVFMFKSRDEALKFAAQDLDFFFTPYWGAAKKPIKTQAEDLVDMFVKFHADPALVAAASVLGVMGFLTELELNNNELITVYLNRNEEIGARGDSGSDLRPAVSESYTELCNTVEQMVNFTPTNTFIALFNNMDALRRRSSLLVSDTKDKPTDTAK